jgi:hypothetical protein
MYSVNNILNLLCLDKDGNIEFEKKDLLKNKEIEDFFVFYFATSKNNKTLYIYTIEKHLKQTNEFFNLYSFDENINLLAKIKLDQKPDQNFVVNGENLFLLNKNEKCCTLSMYNQNLEMVQTFGQENPLLSFFCSPKINLFFVSNKYFIFNETLIGEDDEDDVYYHHLHIVNDL